MAELNRGRPGARSRSEHSLVHEVRWQLFRREDLPARLRRLQRLEQAADPPPRGDRRAPPGKEDRR